MGVQFIMYIGIMWKLLFGPYKGKITLSMNLLGTGVTLAPSGLFEFCSPEKISTGGGGWC